MNYILEKYTDLFVQLSIVHLIDDSLKVLKIAIAIFPMLMKIETLNCEQNIKL